MTVRTLFTTPLYESRCNDAALLDALAHSARVMARDDRAGRAWSKAHGYRGYTSYASLDDPLSDLLGATAAEAAWLADGDNVRFMNDVALRMAN